MLRAASVARSSSRGRRPRRAPALRAARDTWCELVLAPEKLASAALERAADLARVVASRARWVVLRIA